MSWWPDLAMSRYAGVTRYEKIQSDTPGGGYSGGSGGLKKKSASGSSSDAKKEKLLPYEVACNAMQSFLTCKGCTSVANVVASSNKDFSNEYYEATRTTDFAEVASKLMEAIILDFPQYVSKVLDKLSKVLTDTGQASTPSHRVVVAACMAQVLLTDTPVEGSCVEVAVRGLLTVHDDAVPLTRSGH